MAQILDLPQELLDRIAELAEGQCRAVNRNMRNLSKTYYYRHVHLRGTHGRVNHRRQPSSLQSSPPFGKLSLFLRLIIEDAGIRGAVESIQVSWDGRSYDRSGLWDRRPPTDNAMLDSLASTARQYDSALATRILAGECSAQVVLLLHLLPNLRSLTVLGAVDADCVWFALQDFIPNNVLKFSSRIQPPSSLLSLKKLSVGTRYEPTGEYGLDPKLALPWFFLPALSILTFTSLGNFPLNPFFHPRVTTLYGTSQVTELTFFMCRINMTNLAHLLQLPAQLRKLSYTCGDNGVSDQPFLREEFGHALRKLRSPGSLTHLTLETDEADGMDADSEAGAGDLKSFTSLKYLDINLGALLVIEKEDDPQLVELLPPSIEELYIQLGVPYGWAEAYCDIPHQILPVVERQSSNLRRLYVSGVTTNRLGEVRDACSSRGVSFAALEEDTNRDVTEQTRPRYKKRKAKVDN